MTNPLKLLLLASGVLLTGTAVVLVGEGSALPFSSGVEAAPADELVGSIGVNTHLSYSETAYADFDSVKRSLLDLGVRHVRDYPFPQNVDKINDLANEGILLTALMGTPVARPWMPSGLEELYAVVRDDIRPAVAVVEGTNEWDISGEGDWVAQLRTHQEALWRLMRGDDRTNDIPIVAPSITWEYNMNEAGDLSDWADFGNVHPYPGGFGPEQRVAADIASAQANNVGGVPVYVTETGYHDAVSNGRGHPGVSEEVAAVYLPQLFLHYFSIGVPRTFGYELVDQFDDPDDREASFGLLRNDFTPKPAYAAMRELIDLLEDPGPAFTPGRLDYRLLGADQQTRHVLLQKRNGTFYLALWHSASIWDAKRQAPLEQVRLPVTIELDQSIETARVWTLGGDQGSTATLEAPASIDLEVSPTVQIVELVPEQGQRRVVGSPATGDTVSDREP